MVTHESWYEQHFPRLTGQGLWLRSHGLNVVPAPEFHRRPCRVLIARLSSWYDTGVSVSHRIVYRIAAAVEDVFPDLAYLPPPADRTLFSRDRIPWLLGTTTKAGPSAFHCVAFSNATVQELINLPQMLARSGIPLRVSERLHRRDIPLIVLGGANAASAAGLLAGDGLVDGVFVGGAEETIADMFERLRDGVVARVDKSEILERLAVTPGFVVCGPKRPQTRVRAALGPEPPLGRAPVFAHKEQIGTAHVAVADGCPYGCSFCFECWLHRPYREHPVARIEADALAAKANLAAENIELYGYSVASHRGFGTILSALSSLTLSVGFKSQRLDTVAQTPALRETLRSMGKSNLTVGVEGISTRLRNYLDKRLPEPLLRAGLSALVADSVRELKVFLIATGKEQEEDFDEFRTLLEFVRQAAVKAVHPPRVIFSVTPLVCFPWTPLEFADAPSGESSRRVLSEIEAAVRDAGLEYREAAGPDEQFVSQVLARPADSRVTEAFMDAVIESGFVYDRRITRAFAQFFFDRLRERGLSFEELLTGFGPDTKRERPWTVVDLGLSRTMLAERFRTCEAALTTHPSAAPSAVSLRTSAPVVTPAQAAAITNARTHRRQHSREISFLIEIHHAAAGLPRPLAALALAQAINELAPELAWGYDGYRGSLWAGHSDQPCWVTGDDILTFAWQDKAVDLLTSVPDFLTRAADRLAPWGKLKGLWNAERPSRRLVRCRSPYPCAPDTFLRRAHLPATRLRQSEFSYEYSLAPRALKKDIVRRMVVTQLQGNAGAEVLLEVGTAFVPEEFLRTAFNLPSPEDWVRIEMHATLEIEGKKTTPL